MGELVELELSWYWRSCFVGKMSEGQGLKRQRDNKKQEGNGDSIVLMGSPTRAEARVNSKKCGVYRIVNRH